MKEPHISSRAEVALNDSIPKSAQDLQVGDRTFTGSNTPASNSLLETRREHTVFTAWCCRGHAQTYALLPYVKGPDHLSSLSAFMSQRLLNKNAVERSRPWPLTSLTLTYKRQGNNKPPCHSKCLARHGWHVTPWTWHTCVNINLCKQ